MRVNPNVFKNTNPKNVGFEVMWSLLEGALCYKSCNLILRFEIVAEKWSPFRGGRSHKFNCTKAKAVV